VERVKARTLVPLAAFVVALTLVLPGLGRAASYSNDCPVADLSCIALAERLEALVAETEAQTALMSGAGPSEVSGTVALSTDDRDRLDLMWWAAWALVGLTLCMLLAQKWHSAWRFLRE
jgi:hypothetical protein